MGVFLLISKAEKRVQSVIYIQDAHKTERTTFEEEKRKKLTEQESDCFRTVRMFREWAYTKKYVFFCLLNQFVL